MDLATLETRYWRELRLAARGDRGPLCAKLRAGEPPTRSDLKWMADLFEGRLRPLKFDAGGQVKTASAYIRDHEAMILAAEEYARRVRAAGGAGAIRGKSAAMFQAIAAEFKIEDWTKLRNFYRQSASKHKVRVRP